MILDGHIHIGGDGTDTDDFADRLKEAGVDGGIIISQPPAAHGVGRAERSVSQRLDELMRVDRAAPRLYPFFWIDPVDPSAANQVEEALARGVAGFKVICSAHEPGDPRAIDVYRAIAACGKPILFHSGILWDGTDSSRFNRPALFECLLEVEGLRFALAHISWPWCDELIAVYGKFLAARRHRSDLSVEVFIDVTPGTPLIYRRDALTKIFTVGYDVESNVFFGSDGNTNAYPSNYAREWIARDNAIYDELALDDATRERIYSANLMRFLGISR
jgi:predicted TIM-barrel fold metal-dependent hydrolase